MQETNSRNVKSSWKPQVETIGETRLGKVKLNTKHTRQRLSKQKRKHLKKNKIKDRERLSLKKKGPKIVLVGLAMRQCGTILGQVVLGRDKPVQESDREASSRNGVSQVLCLRPTIATEALWCYDWRLKLAEETQGAKWRMVEPLHSGFTGSRSTDSFGPTSFR